MDLFYWNIFCSTYDTQYLNFMSKPAISFLEQFLSDHEFKFKGLKRIIQLHFDDRWKIIPNPNYLTNISTLLYCEKSNKSELFKNHLQNNTIKLYLFGTRFFDQDYLNNLNIINPNLNIINKYDGIYFIANTIQNESKFMDLFIQTDIFSYDENITIEEFQFPNIRINLLKTPDKVIQKIFGKYDKKKYEFSTSPENIIIICDQKNIENYKIILKKINFNIKNSTYSNKGYIDITKFKMPMFS